MFPNVRLIGAAILASVVALGCGFAVFAAFRVNHDPFGRPPSGGAPMQLFARNAASLPVAAGAADPVEATRISEARTPSAADARPAWLERRSDDTQIPPAGSAAAPETGPPIADHQAPAVAALVQSAVSSPVPQIERSATEAGAPIADAGTPSAEDKAPDPAEPAPQPAPAAAVNASLTVSQEIRLPVGDGLPTPPDYAAVSGEPPVPAPGNTDATQLADQSTTLEAAKQATEVAAATPADPPATTADESIPKSTAKRPAHHRRVAARAHRARGAWPNALAQSGDGFSFGQTNWQSAPQMMPATRYWRPAQAPRRRATSDAAIGGPLVQPPSH